MYKTVKAPKNLHCCHLKVVDTRGGYGEFTYINEAGIDVLSPDHSSMAEVDAWVRV